MSGVCDSREALAVVRAITGLGRSLGIATTAEGVETPDQAECLRREGCTQLQGYLYGKPMPAAPCRNTTRSGRPRAPAREPPSFGRLALEGAKGLSGGGARTARPGTTSR